MLIGIDGNEANIENRVGVNVYAFELLWAIYENQKKASKKANPIKFTIYLKNNPLSDMPKENAFWQYKVLPAKGLWIITKLMPALFFAKEKYDVFFSPSHYLPPFSRCPMVFSIMDLGYLEYSGQFRKYDYWQLKVWTAISIFISKRVITISNSSKKDIVRHYPSASKKISVTYPAYRKEVITKGTSKEDVRRIKNKYAIVGDYFLFISTLKPSKNVEGLLAAWKAVERQEKDISLVITGKKGWLYEPIFKKAKELFLKRVIFTGFIPESDKYGLIRAAKGLVLPSFWEGFGLDPLYAMALGTPVLLSRRGSLPEVGGKAAFYFDPEKTEEIEKTILKVLAMSPAGYNKLVERQKKQAEKFTWERAAEKTVSILKKVAEK